MASAGHESEDLVSLVLIGNPDSHREFLAQEHGETVCISVSDILNWDLPSILSCHHIKVEVSRSRLADKSSYFHGLLQGYFSESTLEQVTIEWNVEGVISVLSSIYERPIAISPTNFLLLLEAAFFFGVEELVVKCNAWFSDITSPERGAWFSLPVETTIEIWKFSVEHGVRSIQDRCTSYLAQKFMQVKSSSFFADIPYQLLADCIDDPDLTVHSEKELCDTILDWISKNEMGSDLSTIPLEDYSKILEKIRIHLLPLGYAAGQRTNRHFSQNAHKSMSTILDLIKGHKDQLKSTLNDVKKLENFGIRVSEYSETVDLQGCPQLTATLLVLSLLLPLPKMDSSLKKLAGQSLIELCDHENVYRDLHWPMFYSNGVRHVDMSDCPLLRVHSVVNLCLAFPCMKALKLCHNSDFKMEYLYNLLHKCTMIEEVDLSIDVSPVALMQTSILSATSEEYRPSVQVPYANLQFSANITKLTVEGRTELSDGELSRLSKVIHSLCYINIKGCTSLTDKGISSLICHNLGLLSIIASYTSFGGASVLALCSDSKQSDGLYGASGNNTMNKIASRLKQLEIDKCQAIDHVSMEKLMKNLLMLRTFTAKNTCLDNDALDQFKGSLLEKFDVSETVVSVRALVYVVHNNPNLKVLKMNGCKNLHSSGSIEPEYGSGGVHFEELCRLLGHTFQLNEIAFGWGFSSSSLMKLIPAMKEIKSIEFGVGSSLDDLSFSTLLKFCPSLELVTLYFQAISDTKVRKLSESLRNLRVLNLHCCHGDLTSEGFLKIRIQSLRTLKIEWVAQSMRNNDLTLLTQNCPNLVELKLSGCKSLDSDAQEIISKGWPGLTYLHLEECGNIMGNGAGSILDCKGLQDLLLRHSGRGLKRNFILEAASKLPLLRKLGLDMCDACEGGFDSPSHKERRFLSIVKIARCKSPRCSFDFPGRSCFGAIHHDTIVLEWNSKEHRTLIVKERL